MRKTITSEVETAPTPTIAPPKTKPKTKPLRIPDTLPTGPPPAKA